MKWKVLATVMLVVGSLPLATAAAPTVATPTSIESPDVVQAQDASATTTASADQESGNESETPEDYTKLYVDGEHAHPQLKPGETATFNVSVQNGEDAQVTLDPHVSVPPVGENLLNASWVTIEGDETLDAGEEETFLVTVSVPTDARIGYYRGQIAFTDEEVTYPGRPARPVHATHVNVEVWQEPTVEIVSSTYVRAQIEAGDSVTRQIVIENTGEESVPVNPQIGGERNRCLGNCPSKVDPAWLDIDAPSAIAPGETATVTVTVSPPEDAATGRYDGELDLGLKDPNRPEERTHWQRIRMNFEVWDQPEQPFQTSFEVSEDATNVTLTLSPQSGYYASQTGDSEPASFDVAFVTPSGETIEPERVRVSDRGFVDLSAEDRPGVDRQGAYGVRDSQTTFVYRVEDPEAGSWTLEVMPHNTVGFSYEIVRNEDPGSDE